MVARVSGGFEFVDGAGDGVDLEEAGKKKARGTGADDDNFWGRHFGGGEM